MNKIRDVHIVGILILLMVLRLHFAGKWFGCVVLAGLLVAILDLIKNLYKRNASLVEKRQKFRYGLCIMVLNIFLFSGFVLIALNIILEWKWLNSTTFIDEITLLTLLLSLPQNFILECINKIIQK